MGRSTLNRSGRNTFVQHHARHARSAMVQVGVHSTIARLDQHCPHRSAETASSGQSPTAHKPGGRPVLAWVWAGPRC